jgi:hypothetical protein
LSGRIHEALNTPRDIDQEDFNPAVVKHKTNAPIAARLFNCLLSSLGAQVRRHRPMAELYQHNWLTSQTETGLRLAVETWLKRNGVITITQNKKVLPVFLRKFAHNYAALQSCG